MTRVTENYPGKEISTEQLKKNLIQEAETKELKESKFPTEVIDLPSKGLVYPKEHPLSTGQVEMKYMTAKEEDILTSQNLIQKGIVIDMLLRSLVVGNGQGKRVNYDDLILGDKNAIMVAARVLGYGKDYPVKVKSPNTGEEVEHTVDLTKLNERDIDWSLINDKNEFDFELPASKRKVKVKILTQRDQTRIDKEVKGLARLKKTATATVTMKHVIVDLDGETDNGKIRKFVDTELLAMDSRAIRQFLKSITPDIEMKIEVPDGESGDTFRAPLSIGLDFFWPDVEL